MNYKKSVRQAIENFSKKNEPSLTVKRNKRPEKDLVKQILQLAPTLGLNLHCIESKAVFSQKLNRYISQQAQSGYPDLSGNNQIGQALYIEIKAPGKRSSLRALQREFLLKKIDQNCFAACVDSFELLRETYQEWLNAENKKAILVRRLPRALDKNETINFF